MDQVLNPYNPGSGARPQELAGRAAEVQQLDVALQRLLIGRNGKSQLLTGLRGVGKTALLFEFGRVAARRGFIHEHIEVADDGRLPLRLAVALRKALLKLGGKKKVKGVNRRALGVLKAFTLTLPDGESLLLDVEAVPGSADSGDLASDLGGLFEEVGRAARAHDAGVFLTIDEMHHLPAATLEALVVGLHRVHQLGLPVVIAGAGLPSLPGLRGEARSYLEHMFRFRPLGPLAPDEGADALLLPAAAEGVGWKAGALTRMYEVTLGYPSFIQEFGKQAWDLAEDGSKVIRLSDVERSIPLATAELDEGFFRPRTGNTTAPERVYLRAMAELGPGVVRSGEVAALLSKKTTQVAPVRDTLMKKALCFSPRFNELAFTVPMFDQFMKRWIPRFS
jgi:AAA ATPase domain